MGIFSPKDTSYIKEYTALANCLVESSKLLGQMVSAKKSEYADIAAKMSKVETSAEHAKLDCAKWIAKTFVTVYDRDDMYVLSVRLDNVVDAHDKAVDIIHLFEIKELPSKAEKQVKIFEQLAVSLYAVISGLSNLKSHAEELKKIRSLVQSAEKAHRNLLANLFNEKADVVDIIKMKELIDALDEICASFKLVAGTIETIIIKES